MLMQRMISGNSLQLTTGITVEIGSKELLNSSKTNLTELVEPLYCMKSHEIKM
jgi:hypothetical protein